jgi:putative chitinase
MREESMAFPFSRQAFYDAIRNTVFPGSISQTAVDNMETILNYWFFHHSGNPPAQLAYVLATVRHEVGTDMAPVRETFAASDGAARANLRGKKYAEPEPPSGHAYYGRGYVQLTWLKNYQAQQKKLGIKLAENPDLALDPNVATRILVEGMLDGDFSSTGHGLGHYVNAATQDYFNARQTVNLHDKAHAIAATAHEFAAAIARAIAVEQAGGVVVAPPVQLPASVPQGIPQGAFSPADIAALSARIDALASMMSAHLADHALGAGSPASPVSSLPAPTAPSAPNSAIAAILAALKAAGIVDGSASGGAKLDGLLKALESSGIIQPGNGLTPVNAALGETIGKALDGKKTVIGTLGMLAATLVPALGPAIPALAPVAAIVAKAAPVLLPVASALAGWGVLGKIDKWMHQPLAALLGKQA